VSCRGLGAVWASTRPAFPRNNTVAGLPEADDESMYLSMDSADGACALRCSIRGREGDRPCLSWGRSRAALVKWKSGYRRLRRRAGHSRALQRAGRRTLCDAVSYVARPDCVWVASVENLLLRFSCESGKVNLTSKLCPNMMRQSFGELSCASRHTSSDSAASSQ
jgi:hypothetical protein